MNRVQLRDYIIEHKLTDDFWSGKIAAECRPVCRIIVSGVK